MIKPKLGRWNYLLKKNNRIIAKQPRGRSGWCNSCDMAVVRPGQRCPACGHKSKPFRDKKLSPME